MNVQDNVFIFDKPIGENSIKSLVKFLSNEDSKLHYEAVIKIAQITLENLQLTKMLVEAGAIESIVRLLSSNDTEIQEYSSWTLANILG